MVTVSRAQLSRGHQPGAHAHCGVGCRRREHGHPPRGVSVRAWRQRMAGVLPRPVIALRPREEDPAQPRQPPTAFHYESLELGLSLPGKSRSEESADAGFCPIPRHQQSCLSAGGRPGPCRKAPRAVARCSGCTAGAEDKEERPVSSGPRLALRAVRLDLSFPQPHPSVEPPARGE